MLLKSQFYFCSVIRLKLVNTVVARISKNCLIFNNILIDTFAIKSLWR